MLFRSMPLSSASSLSNPEIRFPKALTPSPVRIVRDQKLTANMAGIYPCGEGAGYAGGITSAAMDGIKVAETVCRKYAAIKNN